MKHALSARALYRDSHRVRPCADPYLPGSLGSEASSILLVLDGMVTQRCVMCDVHRAERKPPRGYCLRIAEGTPPTLRHHPRRHTPGHTHTRQHNRISHRELSHPTAPLVHNHMRLPSLRQLCNGRLSRPWSAMLPSGFGRTSATQPFSFILPGRGGLCTTTKPASLRR